MSFLSYSLPLGTRSLIYRKKQYISIFFVCMIGVGISLFCLSLINGMMFSLNSKARLYYGGDLQFMGGMNMPSYDDSDSFVDKLTPIFPKNTVIAERVDFEATNTAMYYEGVGLRQRIVKGINFNKEQKLFSTFTYVDGNAKEMAGTNGVLLSEPIAKMLEVHVGDPVTFMLSTAQGYTNTIELVVKGIFKDSSLFGMYTSYMDIDYLRNAYGYPAKWANRIGIFFPDGAPSQKQIDMYQSQLEKIFEMAPQVKDKKQFYDVLLSGGYSVPTYALIKLSANLQDVQVLIDAMKAITGFIIVMLIVIIVAGIASTYRVLVMKRINEIGIYMAIGMSRFGICSVLLCEVFSLIPAFDIFLTNGNLVPIINGQYTVSMIAIVIVTTVIAVLFAIQKSVKMTPVEALGVTE